MEYWLCVVNLHAQTTRYNTYWTIAAQFVDIMTYNTSVRIRGFISVGGAIYLDPSIAERTVKPLVFECAAALTSPSSTDVFQEGLLNFLHACSEKLSTDLFRVLLEGMVLQPRAAAVWVHKRKQDPERMLEEARAGKLPLLAIGGGKDKFLNAEGFKATYEDLGWKKMTYRHLEDADHIPWVSCPEEFREVVLAWFEQLHPRTEQKGGSFFLPSFRPRNILNWIMSR
jgi:pimeloyl-ACP methyl ester carboxylesterase